MDAEGRGASPNNDGLESAFVYTSSRMNAIQKTIKHELFYIVSKLDGTGVVLLNTCYSVYAGHLVVLC